MLDALPFATQQCQSPEGNSKNWFQPRKINYWTLSFLPSSFHPPTLDKTDFTPL